MTRPISNRETFGRCTTVIAYPEPAVPLDELADIECLAMIYRRHAAPIDHTPFPWSVATYTDFIFARANRPVKVTKFSCDYLHREPRSSSRYLYSRYSGVVQLKYRSAVVLRPKNFVAILLFIVDKYSSFLENTIVRIVVNTREDNLLEDLKR